MNFFNVLKVKNKNCKIINMMKILNFTFKMLKNPILKVELSKKNLNISTCTKCPILQNGLHVDEILIFLRFQFSGTLKNTNVLLYYGCYNHNTSNF
jgi:hypothetical protein